jgi:hypothetical protein
LTASSARNNGDAERVRLIAEVKAAGDVVAAKINLARSACDAQISQLAAVSTISGTETQMSIQDGKRSVDLVATVFLNELQFDESEGGRLAAVSNDAEQLLLSTIAQVGVTALGNGSNRGELEIVCQSVIVEIQVKVRPLA